MTSLSVDTVSTPNGVAILLKRLSAGEEIIFHDRDMLGRDVSSFTLQKVGSTYVTRQPDGQVLSSTATFAEAWRRRPRATETAEGSQ